jgi:hypothetical protein
VSDAIDLLRSLGIGGGRRDEEGERERVDDCSAVHYSIT